MFVLFTVNVCCIAINPDRQLYELWKEKKNVLHNFFIT